MLKTAYLFSPTYGLDDLPEGPNSLVGDGHIDKSDYSGSLGPKNYKYKSPFILVEIMLFRV